MMQVRSRTLKVAIFLRWSLGLWRVNSTLQRIYSKAQPFTGAFHRAHSINQCFLEYALTQAEKQLSLYMCGNREITKGL